MVTIEMTYESPRLWCRDSMFFLDGNKEMTYEWGLGKVTNNQVEALALFQGLKYLDTNYIKKCFNHRILGHRH